MKFINPAKTSGNKNLIGVLLSVFFAGFLAFIAPVFAGNDIFSTDFEEYEIGILNGNYDWSGDNDFEVQSSVFYSGSKAIGISTGAGAFSILQAPSELTLSATGSISFWTKRSQTDSNQAVKFGSAVIFDLSADGSDYLNTSDGQKDLGLASTDWTLFEFEWSLDEFENEQVRARKNGGSWTSFAPPLASILNVNQLSLDSDSGSFYFDKISSNEDSGEEEGLGGRLFDFPAGFVAQISSGVTSFLSDLAPVFQLVIGVWLAMWIIQWLISLSERRDHEKRLKSRQ